MVGTAGFLFLLEILALCVERQPFHFVSQLKDSLRESPLRPVSSFPFQDLLVNVTLISIIIVPVVNDVRHIVLIIFDVDRHCLR